MLDPTNILFGLSYLNNTFLDYTNGETRTLSSFLTYKDIPIPSGVTKLWPYSNANTTKCFRSIAFFDTNNNYISGLSGTLSLFQVGVAIPTNAAYLSVCFSSPVDLYYLSIEQGNPDYLKESIFVNYQNLKNAPAIPTKTSELQNDSGFITGDGVAAVIVNKTDIIDEEKRINNRFINPTTGEISTNSAFFSFQLLPIPKDVTRLWPYASQITTNCFRSLIFLDESQTFISGISGTLSYSNLGCFVPTNAKFVNVCFSNNSDSYYLSIEQGNPVYKSLQSDILINFTQINEIPKEFPRIRLYPKTKLPCISLQFDDCYYEGDTVVVEYMKSIGCVCDFAFIANITYLTQKIEYLDWNKCGFGIQNHSVDEKIFNESNYTYETALNTILTARTRLENAGFVVNGFVCPSSSIAESFKPILAIHGSYAFTTMTADPSANGRTSDRCDLHRYSMQNHTLTEILNFIDSAITNDQIITLYGHTADFGTTYSDLWDLTKVKSIVEYIISKRDKGLIYFNNTDNCIKKYFDL